MPKIRAPAALMACCALLLSCGAEQHSAGSPAPSGPTPGDTATPINWMLNSVLSECSRDNLPNPVQGAGRSPFVPDNMPAIGDLFDLFEFSR